MIKSQDDLNPCNDGKRSSDVLVATIEKCEKLQKQLDKAIEGLEVISTFTCILDEDTKTQVFSVCGMANSTLKKIKELEK